MKTIQKISTCAIFLAIFSLTGGCDTTILKEIKTLEGKALYDYIETIAYQPFGSYESLFDDTNDEITDSGLSNEDIDEWLSLNDCISSYLHDVEDYMQRVNYAAKFTLLQEIITKLPIYAQNLKNRTKLVETKENLNKEISRVKDIFLICLNVLPSPNFQNIRSVNEILNSYKNQVGISFDPKSFFGEYKKHSDYYKAENRTMTPPITFKFLYGTNVIPHITNSEVGIYKQSQHAVANLIYLLEQLIYASQNTKSSRWSIKKQTFLTPEQITMGKDIIKSLYTLFPGVEVLTFSLQQVNKPMVMLLAQSRILLIILQNFKRTADYLINKSKP